MRPPFAYKPLWAALLCVHALPGSAEEFLDMPLEELMELKVTVASRFEQSVEEAPAVVSVITREQMDAWGIDSLEELLPYVPGYSVAMDSAVATRTPLVSARGQHQAKLLILLDGEPINDYNNSNPLIFHKHLDLWNVDHVEILRGPGSYLYGTAAFVGTVNLVTRKAPNEVRARVGGNGAREASVALSRGGAERHVSLFAHTWQDDGQRYHDLFDRFGLTDTARDPRSGSVVQLKGGYKGLGFSLYHSRVRFEDFYQFGNLGAENYDQTDFSAAELYYEPAAGRDFESHFGLGYRRLHAEAVGQEVPAGMGPFTEAPFLVGPYFTHEVVSANARFVSRLANGHQLSYGAGWERAQSPEAFPQANYDYTDPGVPYLGGIEVLDGPGQRFVKDVQREVTGVYLQDQFELEGWDIALGGRYDRFSDVGDNFSPQVAAGYALAPGRQVKMVYGEAFQAPAMGSLYNRENPDTLGNPQLDPERVRSVNLEYRAAFDRYSVSTTLFWNRTYDVIERVPVGDINHYLNVGSQESAGLELEFNYRFDPYWSLRWTHAELFRNEFESDRPLSGTEPDRFVPDRYGSLAVDYQRGPWGLNLNGTWRSEVDVLDSDRAVGIANAVLRYRTPGDGLELYLEADNLFDTEYDSPSAGTGLGTVDGNVVRKTPNRGRWLYAGVIYRF